MEQKIKNVISKVRELLGNSKEYKDFLKYDARVEILEKKGELEIFQIKIGYYDNIVITEKELYFLPERQGPVTLLKYDGYDELLELCDCTAIKKQFK